jgi:hypothetical protein
MNSTIPEALEALAVVGLPVQIYNAQKSIWNVPPK